MQFARTKLLVVLAIMSHSHGFRFGVVVFLLDLGFWFFKKDF